MSRNIFIVGTDDFNLSQLKTVPGAEDYAFHTLSSYEQAKAGDEYPVEAILEQSRRRLNEFQGRIDAIVGWWDFPVSTLLPILRREYGLPGPTLESVLKCEHKYWSRIEQMRFVPDHVPPFEAVDPFAEDAADTLQLAFPLWIKPVKAASSYLGFKVHDRDELREVLAVTREKIHRLARPFNRILGYADLPPEIAGVDGWHCIAEGIISRGRQCTLEGYMYRGEMSVYGVIDSRREGKHRSSFSRYEYPSSLPEAVCERMKGITQTFMEKIGFDNSPFNIEFYWDEKHDAIWLLEINSRISKSHCPLFKMVDGSYHHQVMLEVALGRRPRFAHRQGRYKVAAKFMLRRHEDATVTRIPSEKDIEALKQRYPDTEVLVHVQEGQRLSQMKDQDSYSYEIGVIFIGAQDRHQLLARYDEALESLNFEFSE